MQRMCFFLQEYDCVYQIFPSFCLVLNDPEKGTRKTNCTNEPRLLSVSLLVINIIKYKDSQQVIPSVSLLRQPANAVVRAETPILV